MKLAMLYDFETTGLPLWNLPSEHPDQPRATQIAAELFDDDTGETYASCDFIIRPDGWTIPEELQQLTGITMEKANRVGVDIIDAMHAVMEMWQNADGRVAHNESFDARIGRIELMKHSFFSKAMMGDIPFADHWKAGAAFCTCASSTKIINLPPTDKMKKAGRNNPKPPNLAEAYEFFTGQKLEGAHNARIDIMAAKKVYFGIRDHEAAKAAAA